MRCSPKVVMVQKNHKLAIITDPDLISYMFSHRSKVASVLWLEVCHGRKNRGGFRMLMMLGNDHPVPMMLGQFAQFSMPSMDHLPE